jgi:hypothetical protein
MVSFRLLFSLAAVPVFVAVAVVACSDDGTPVLATVDGGESSSSGGSSSGGTSSSGSGSSSGDPDPDSSTETDATAPDVDGGGPCGTHAFGKAAANFQGLIDASDNGAYQGGAFELASYDAVIAERLSGNPGSWRETFVVGANNRFSRVRQTDLDGGALGEIRYRAGTYSGDAGQLLLTFDCAIDGDASIADPSDTFPYEVVTVGGKRYYRYGAAGVRIWLERR